MMGEHDNCTSPWEVAVLFAFVVFLLTKYWFDLNFQ